MRSLDATREAMTPKRKMKTEMLVGMRRGAAG
jgi:hypothetical protein